MQEKKHKKIICIDFDGTLHSHRSKHPNMREVIDPPVIDTVTGKSSIDWLMEFMDTYCDVPDSVADMAPAGTCEVHIFSARSRHWGGRKAMKKWLIKNGFDLRYLEMIKFPLTKPVVHLIVDDRAFHFQGTFPTGEYIENFKPWDYKK